jgi:hypothetical protein
VASAQPFLSLLGAPVTRNISLRGSACGDTYARAFLDYLKDIPTAQLPHHLKAHYTMPTATGQALSYEPGQFTRLPNRYYQFRYGEVEFFALDSSTFNRPVDIDGSQVLTGQLTHAELPPELDWEQLLWLRDRLIRSHQDLTVKGRILYLHHPPYVTETSKVQETACLSVRRHFRWVLDAVTQKISLNRGQPLLDLILSGHAHCFEYLRTLETDHSDRFLNWMICGGSGARLRSQHPDTAVYEARHRDSQVIAKSQIFIGRHGQGTDTHLPYSFLRIDVQPAQTSDRLQFQVRPFITEFHHDSVKRWTFNPIRFNVPQPF